MKKPEPKEIKAECYLLVESNDCCKGIRFKLPSGKYIGLEIKPHSIKLTNPYDEQSDTGQIPGKRETT
jgi:hypothetical protein